MGKVLTVYSPKGGVGKTTLTLALARVLSYKHKVVVVEVDFTPGDMSTILEVEPKGLAVAQGTGVETSIQCPAQESFDVLTGGFPDVGELASHEAVVSIIADLRERYDYVIIDTQSYLTEGVVAALRAADRLLLVTDESITSVARVLGMVDYLKGNGFADLDRAGLVVNRRGFAASKYVAVAEFPFPTVCRIPEFSRFAGFRDARLAKIVGALI
ncbi:MAG: ParA family protein [Peptococcaceae bacterium]|nr:ParA family protein [Peptococcaceae bacterium]